MTAFDPVNPDTWPPMLSAEQVAAIYHRTPSALKVAIHRQRKRPVRKDKFIPMPAMMHPHLWRKSDILRHVRHEGAGGGLQIASGF